MAQIVLALVGTLLVSLLAQTTVLWGTSRLLRRDRASLRRALTTVLVLTAISLVAWPAFRWSASAAVPVMLAWALACLVLVVTIVVIKVVYQVRPGRASAMAVVFLVGSLAACLPLAIGMRAIALEGFVLSTGGMAPTLIGDNVAVACGPTGQRHLVSARTHLEARNRNRSVTVRCPDDAGEVIIDRDALVHAGDRFLVEKLSTPRRWDVITFHAPIAPKVKYVMRLIGLPGETVELIGGDVFIDGRRLVKAPREQLDLWFPVAGGDRPARGSWQPPANGTWSWADDRWRFSGGDDVGGMLRFEGEIDDDLPYNASEPIATAREPSAVGDIRVSFDMERSGGTGPLVITWDFDDRIVRSTIDAASVTIESGATSAGSPLDATGPSFVELAVRDGVATLFAGEQVLQIELADRGEPARRRPELDGGRLTIAASSGDLVLSRLRLARDVHYTCEPRRQDNCTAPLTLGPAEHYVLGDNPTMSLDSRYWDRVDPRYGGHAIGTVPAEAITGVARVVYWPPSRWQRLDR